MAWSNRDNSLTPFSWKQRCKLIRPPLCSIWVKGTLAASDHNDKSNNYDPITYNFGIELFCISSVFKHFHQDRLHNCHRHRPQKCIPEAKHENMFKFIKNSLHSFPIITVWNKKKYDLTFTLENVINIRYIVSWFGMHFRCWNEKKRE